MSRISNLNTIRIGLYRSWNSYWFDSYYYSYLLFSDLRIRDYITGVFYRLNTITDYLHIYRFLSDSILIKTSLIFLGNLTYKSIYVDSLYKLDNSYRFFYNKRLWNIFLYGLRVLSLVDGLKVILKSDILYEFGYFLSYFFIYRLLPYYHNKLNNLSFSLNRVIHINYTDLCNSSLLLLYSSDLHISNANILKFLKYSYIYIYYDDLISSFDSVVYYLNSHYELSNINLSSLIFYYVFSYISYYNNYIYLSWSKSYSFFSYIKSLNSINSFIFIFLVNILVLLKYIVYITDTINYNNLVRLSKLVSKFITLDTILDNFIIGDFFVYDSIINNLNIYSIRENITKTIVSSLRYNLERSIYLFENKNVYFYFSLFIKRIPYLISAKVITDLLVYLLESGNKIVKSFYFIRNLQKSLNYRKRELEYIFHSRRSELLYKEIYNREQYEIAKSFYEYIYHLAYKRYPLLGIRIECSGSFKKGNMARTYHYTSWAKSYALSGSMPNNTLIADIDYYQYYTTLNSGSIGIKTWIFLETHLYNYNNTYIGLLY